MDENHIKGLPGVEFLTDSRGRRNAVLIDLKKHRALLEDILDTYLARRRRREPRESLAQVQRVIGRAPQRKSRA